MYTSVRTKSVNMSGVRTELGALESHFGDVPAEDQSEDGVDTLTHGEVDDDEEAGDGGDEASEKSEQEEFGDIRDPPLGCVRLRPSHYAGLPATVFFDYPRDLRIRRRDESIIAKLGDTIYHLTCLLISSLAYSSRYFSRYRCQCA